MTESNLSTAVSLALTDTIRWCSDIGMYGIDRSREASCDRHATKFCKKTCFNEKLEKAFGHAIEPKDVKNDIAWSKNIVSGLSAFFKRRKKRQTKRARLMTRGEAFRDMTDIPRVIAILRETPDTVWWIPTRCWRDPILWLNVRNAMANFPNVVLLASTDPTTTDTEYARLERQNISTMFYGDDKKTHTPNGTRMFKCPKTHRKLDGHCAICKAGCFNQKKTVHVHLKQH